MSRNGSRSCHQSSHRTSRRTRSGGQRIGSAIESLESRQLLAVDLVSADALLATGTSADDQFTLRAVFENPAQFEILLNGVSEFVGSKGVFTGGLEINGLVGNDTLVVDYSNGIPVPAGGVYFRGNIPDGGGPIGDVLSVFPGDDLTYELQAQPGVRDTGIFLVEGSPLIGFSGVEQLRVSGEEYLRPDAYEPNESLATAVPLGSEPAVTVRNLTIHPLGGGRSDTDLYRVTASQTGMLIVNALFDHAGGNLELAIQDERGLIVASALSATDNERIVIPVVAQETYYVQVFGPLSATNEYALEIENFAAPEPRGVLLQQPSDTGTSNSDGVTAQGNPTFSIVADLSSLESQGIAVLTSEEARAGDVPGAAVVVRVTSIETGVASTGFADRITAGVVAGGTFFEYRSATLPEGEYTVTAAVQIFDVQRRISTTPGVFTVPNPATGRSGISEPATIVVDLLGPDITPPQMLPSSDSGMLNRDGVTNEESPAFVGITEPGSLVRVLANGSLVGEGIANVDGRWEITVEPLVDGVYSISNQAYDLAGNFSENLLTQLIEIDTLTPNTPYLDLVSASDTGTSDHDDVTGDNTLTFTMTTTDPNSNDHIDPANFKYRLYVRPEGGAERLIFDSSVDLPASQLADGLTELSLITAELPALPDGTHNFKLEVEDRAGNISDDFLLPITIDSTLPPAIVWGLPAESDTGMSDSDRVTRFSQPTIDGLAEAGAMVSIFSGTRLVGMAQVGSDETDGDPSNGLGRFKLTTTALDDGIHVLTAMVEDNAGNVRRTETQSIEVDTEAPNTPILDLIPGSDTGSSLTDEVTRAPGLSFSFATEDPGPDGHLLPMNYKYRLFVRRDSGAEELVYTSVGDSALAVDQTDGVFTNLEQLQRTIEGLPEGVHNFKLEVEDRAGNISQDFLLNVHVDRTLLGDATFEMAGGSDTGMDNLDRTTRISQPTFTGLAEVGATVFVMANSVLVGIGQVPPDSLSPQDELGTWSVTTSPLADGTYVMTVQIEDLAGNRETSTASTIEVDTTPPNTPYLDLAIASDSGVSGTDNVTGRTDLTLNMTTTDPALADRANPFNYKYRLFLRPEGGTETLVYDSSLDTLIASDADALGFTRLERVQTTLQNLPAGTHNFKLEVEDRAGNISSDTLLTVTIDPQIAGSTTIALLPSSDAGMSPTDNVTQISSPTFSGLGEAGGRVELHANGRLVGVGTVGSDASDGEVGDGLGLWSVTSETLADNTYEVLATVEDASGNVSRSETITVEIDTFEPNIPLLNLVDRSDSGLSATDNVTRLNLPTFNMVGVDRNSEAHGDPNNYQFRLFVRLDSGVERLIYTSVGDTSLDAALTDGVFTSLSELQRTIDIPMPDGTHNFKLEVEDRAGNISDAFLLDVTFDSTLDTPAAGLSADLLTSADSGMSGSDNVTRINRPSFAGVAEVGARVSLFADGLLVGTGIVGSDETDRTANDGLGAWHVTTQPLTDGPHEITVHVEDLAGNSAVTAPVTIEVDTAAPNTPYLDLVGGIRSDVGSETTTSGTLTLTMTTTDPASELHLNPFNYKYRLYLRPAGGAEQLVYNSATDASIPAANMADGLTDLTLLQTTINDLPAGTHNLKLEVEDRAGNISQDYLLNVQIVAPSTIDAMAIAILPSSDTGMDAGDNVTQLNQPAFHGQGTIGAQVRLLANDTIIGTGTVGGDASNGIVGDGLGAWEITSEPLRDGIYTVLAEIEGDFGAVARTEQIVFEVDTLAPNTPHLDLQAASDSGVSNTDNVTSVTVPLINMATIDPNQASHLSAYNYKYRLFARDAAGERLVYDSVTDDTITDKQGGFVRLESLQRAIDLGTTSGVQNLKLEVEDRAGNISQDVLLNVTIDTSLQTPDGTLTAGLLTNSDTGMSEHDGVTSKDRPVYSGIAEVGATVSLFANGNLIGSGVVGSDETDFVRGNGLGVWQVATENLDDGVYSVLVHVEDAAGNFLRSEPLDLEVDTIAPNTPLLDLVNDTGHSRTDNITGATSLIVSMTSSDTEPIGGHVSEFNFKYRVYVRSEQGEESLIYDSVTDPNLDPDRVSAGFTDLKQITTTLAALPDGVHNLKLEVEDRAGNISHDFLLSVEIDSTLTGIPTLSLIASSDTGMSSTDRVTKLDQPAFTGVAEVGTTARLRANGVLIGVVEVGTDLSDGVDGDGFGAWEMTSEPLRDGVHQIDVEIEDWAGNFRRSEAITVEVDTLVPNTPLLDLLSASDSGISNTDNITNTGNMSFAMTTTDPNSASHLNAANYKYRLYVRGESRSETLVYASSDDAALAAELSDGLISLESLQRQFNLNLVDGSYNFKLEVEDRAGNISDDFLLNVTIDRQLATPNGQFTASLLASSDTGMSDADQVTKSNQPVLGGIAEVGAMVRVFANGVLVGTGIVGSDASDFVPGDGLGAWQIATDPLDDGIYNVLVQADDLAGNVAVSSELSIEIDTLAPNTPYLDLLNDTGHSHHDNITQSNTLQLNMTTEDPLPMSGRLSDFNLKYRIFLRPEGGQESLVYDSVVDAGINGAFLSGGLTNLSQLQTTLSTLPDGIHNLKLEVEDRAGNISDDYLLTVQIDSSLVNSAAIDLLTGSDTGMSGDDNVTNKDQPTFVGLGEVGSTVRLYANAEFVGVAEVQSDLSDGVLGNGLGRWQVTTQPLRDGIHQVSAEVEDWAGNVQITAPITVEIDTEAPNTPLLDLLSSSDSGLTGRDEVTTRKSLTFGMTTTDPRQAEHLSSLNYKYRLYVRSERTGEVLVYDSSTDTQIPATNTAGGLTNLEYLERTLAELPDGMHHFKLEVEDRAGNISDDFLLNVQIDTSLSEPTISLVSSSDTGMSSADGVTNLNQPAFTGTGDVGDHVRLFANGVLIGTGVVSSDDTDGEIGNGRGAWEITSEPLSDGVYTISATTGDLAGNFLATTTLTMEVDTLAPNTPFLDLREADDSGRHNDDNITNADVLRFTATSEDPNSQLHTTLFPNGQNLKYRLYVRPESGAETLVYQSALDANQADLLDGLTASTLINIPGLALPEGLHNLKLEVEDRAGNISEDFLMEVLVDRTPFQGTLTIGAGNDTGVWGIPSTLNDGITADASPTLGGTAEANSIVTVSVDGVPVGTTVALPFDGDDALQPPNPEYAGIVGNWELRTSLSLGGGDHEIAVTFEDPAGNRSTITDANTTSSFVIDAVGPRIDNVTRSDANFTSLFELKPDGGPDPLINSIIVHFSDGPDRTAAIPYSAVLAELALEEGNYQLVGDANGNIPIVNVVIVSDVPGPGVARTAVQLQFAAPLPDDRYTLHVSDRISDRAGNPLDGESGALAPFVGQNGLAATPPIFSTGDGNHGAAFNARFTVDSRPEIGVWAAGSIWVDTNGNFQFDSTETDYVNRDIVYNLGFTSDDVFAGNFSSGDTTDGYDKLAAYGRRGGWADGTFRWLIDLDNDGNADLDVEDPADVNGLPIAGRFDSSDANGDEVAVFTGTTWHFDTDHDFRVDTELGTTMRGYPIVGDFDGDGFDDLATWADDQFQIDLAGGTRNGWDGAADVTFRYGFIGVRERPVAADMDQDGFDDLGLWVPDREGVVPRASSEWYWLVSGGATVLDRVEPSRDPVRGQVQQVDFTPIPFGSDMFAQFGDSHALPIVGNFDPPSVPTAIKNDGSYVPTSETAIFTNWANPLDVSHDGFVTARDVVMVVNWLNSKGPVAVTELPLDAGYLDANGDGHITARDALAVVNGLNQFVSAEADASIDTIAADVASALLAERR